MVRNPMSYNGCLLMNMMTFLLLIQVHWSISNLNKGLPSLHLNSILSLIHFMEKESYTFELDRSVFFQNNRIIRLLTVLGRMERKVQRPKSY